MDDTYKKSKGNAGLAGVQFQIGLLTVFFLNAFRKLKNWRLSTENRDAAKFDDLVLELPDGSTVLLQAKYREDRKVTKEQLLSVNSKHDDFSLPKYFFSHHKVKDKFQVKSIVICTNTEVEEKGLESALVLQKDAAQSMLHYGDEGDDCWYFTFNENILPDLKASAEIYYKNNLQGKEIDREVLSDENLKEFLSNLQFFTGYPSGEKLNKVIELLLSRFNKDDLWSNTSCLDVYKKVEDWFKQRRGEYLTESLAKKILCEIKSDKICTTLKNCRILLLHNFTFTDTKRVFHVTAEKGHLLQVLKIYRSLLHGEAKSLYASPEDGLYVQKQVVQAFSLPQYTFLIMIRPRFREKSETVEIYEKIKEILNKYKYKKVVLVAERGNELARLLGCQKVDGTVKFKHLSKDSQRKLAEKENVIFQGRPVSLERLIGERNKEVYDKGISGEILEKLVKGEDIKVGSAPSDLDEHIDRFYVHRTLRREVDKAETGDRNGDKKKEIVPEDTVYDIKEKVVLIADSAGMGKSTILTKIALDIKKKYPHLWVIRIELNDCTSLLKEVVKKNRKKINIMELLTHDAATALSNSLEKVIFSSRGRVVLLLDGVDEICPDYSELIFGLLGRCREAANIAKVFVTTRPHMAAALETVLKTISFILEPFSEQNQIDFLTAYWSHNLRLKERSTKARCELYAKALIKRISSWMKSNYHSEKHFVAVPLQVRIVAEIFQENVKIRESSDWEGCKEYLKTDKKEPKLPERLNIMKLYDIFVEKKRDVFLFKGNPNGNTTANKALTDQFDKCLAYHRCLALELILGEAKDGLFSICTGSEKNLEMDMLKIGMVQKWEDQFYFLHRTFAEYFVAQSILRELQTQKENLEFQKFFIEEVLHKFKYNIIRSFLDNFLREYVDSLPGDVFKQYQSLDSDNTQCKHCLLHLLAKEGCVALLELVLKSIGFRIVRHIEIHISNCQKLVLDNILSVFQTIVGKRSGNTLKVIQELVRQGGVNVKNEYGKTPLHYAAQEGRLDMVRYLVKQGANLDSRDRVGRTALHLAAAEDQFEAVKFLVHVGVGVNIRDNYGFTALHIAAEEGELETVKILLHYGIDASIKNKDGRTALHLAANWGRVRIVEFFAELGLPLDEMDNDGHTALHLAAWGSGFDTVKYLVGRNVNVNAKNHDGRTALQLAALWRRKDIVEFLVTFGADVTVTDTKGHNALHLAAFGNGLDIVRFLVDCGLDATVRDCRGCTALHIASWEGHLDIVKYLVGLGMRVNDVDERGRTALYLATTNGNWEVMEFLRMQRSYCVRLG